MKHLFIVNPVAGGKNRHEYVAEQARLALEGSADAYEVYITAAPMDACAKIAAEAASGEELRVYACGGDGTLNECVNGAVGHDNVAVTHFPCGTGNDFVKVLPLPKDPLKALECQLDSPACPVDIGQVNDRYFLNIAGTGFDVEVLRQTTRFKWLGGGLLPYLCGVVAALRRFKPMDIELTINGKTEKRRVTIISIGNGQYLGGGMRAVPQADPMDGLFDVIYVDAVNRHTIARLLPHFIKGTHTGLPIAHCARCTEVVINSPGMTFNLDGELHDMDRAFCRMLPGALTLHLPDEDEPADRR